MRMGFLERLVNRAADITRIRRFFGIVAYVINTLEAGKSGQNKIRMPTQLKRIRPQTAPLTEEEQKMMLNYKAERDAMRFG